MKPNETCPEILLLGPGNALSIGDTTGAPDLTVHNNALLQEFTENYQREMKWRPVRTLLDSALSATIAYFSEPDGKVPNNFPIFSYAGYAGISLPETILLKQDHLQADTLAEFLHLFKRMDRYANKTIILEYHDRDSALKLLSNIQSLASVSELFGQRKKTILLPEPVNDNPNAISDLMTENHLAALCRLEKSGNLAEQLLAAKHLKYNEHPPIAASRIQAIINSVLEMLLTAKAHEVKYLNSVIVSLKLDLAYVLDRESSPIVLEAMALARQIGDDVLLAHCQKFATLCLDVTPEAIAMLDSACRTLSQYPEYTEENGHILPSLFGAISNRNTTSLILPGHQVIPESMKDDYFEAKARLPSYQNMALLGNGAAVACLVKGRFKEAREILENCYGDNAEITDRLNVRCNLLIAQYLETGGFNEVMFQALVTELQQYDMGENWDYLKIRMGLNLLRIAQTGAQSEAALAIISHSPFWSEGIFGKSHAELLEIFLKKRFHYYFENGKMKGCIGDFVRTFGLFPGIDKDYT